MAENWALDLNETVDFKNRRIEGLARRIQRRSREVAVHVILLQWRLY